MRPLGVGTLVPLRNGRCGDGRFRRTEPCSRSASNVTPFITSPVPVSAARINYSSVSRSSGVIEIHRRGDTAKNLAVRERLAERLDRAFDVRRVEVAVLLVLNLVF